MADFCPRIPANHPFLSCFPIQTLDYDTQPTTAEHVSNAAAGIGQLTGITGNVLERERALGPLPLVETPKTPSSFAI